MKWRMWIAGAMFAFLALAGTAANYHVDSANGDDANDGLTPATAWKSLDKTSGLALKAGDSVLLKRGCVFEGHLFFEKATGAEGKPVLVDAYGEGAAPVINASKNPPCIRVTASDYVTISNLELTADANTVGAGNATYNGVLLTMEGGPVHHVNLRKLHIHDIFGKTKGDWHAIDLVGGDTRNELTDILIEGCEVERTGGRGLSIRRTNNVRILDNNFKDIGGPCIQPSLSGNLVIRGNTVNGSGSRLDPRMQGRGSCAWVLGCSDVLVEKNTFMNAWGILDSCGFHLDIGNTNAVVQYNLSMNNAGGFVEILGRNRNCAYRYNISVNDGWRVRKTDGAIQDGHVLFVSGYTVERMKAGVLELYEGPYNSYIYNNTIYVQPEITSTFWFGPTANGLLIANNIFHLLGPTKNTYKPEPRDPQNARIQNVFFKNNLYLKSGILPGDLPIRDEQMMIGDAGFARPGGMKPTDYIPHAVDLVRDKGIKIPKLPGDPVGLKIGLEVKADFFGNPISGLPDLGAVEAR